MAEDAINDKSLTSILPNVKLQVIKSAGGCSLDTVMRIFVNYYIQPQRVLGVLGPPCSEAVEPIAGELYSFIWFVVNSPFGSYKHRTIFVIDS